MKIYVVTYVGLSDSDYDANGYCDAYVFGALDDAKAAMRRLREKEIDYLKEDNRDYEILEDEDDMCRLSWCGHGEQLRIEVHEAEIDIESLGFINNNNF